MLMTIGEACRKRIQQLCDERKITLNKLAIMSNFDYKYSSNYPLQQIYCTHLTINITLLDKQCSDFVF